MGWGVRRTVNFYESVDQVWVPSPAALETLRQYGYRGPAELVRNGVDLQPPAQAEGGPAPRARSGEFLLLFVGQHAWEKNLAFLIQSLAAARGMGARFRMVFVGEGYAAGAMKTMVDQLGLADCTTFAGVVCDRSALSAHYARVDCFLFPSQYDTNGLSVIEAAAFGVPSLLIRGSAVAEVRDRYIRLLRRRERCGEPLTA